MTPLFNFGKKTSASQASAKPPTVAERAGSAMGKTAQKTATAAGRAADAGRSAVRKIQEAADKATSFTERVKQLCEATGADSEVQAVMLSIITAAIGESAVAAVEGAIPGWGVANAGIKFAQECDHLVGIVRARAQLERRIEREYFRANDATKAIEGLLQLMERDVKSSTTRTATSGLQFAVGVAGLATATPAALDSIASALAAVVNLMRKIAEIVLEVRDMVEANKLIKEHFANGIALTEVFQNPFLGTFIAAKAPEAYLMNVSLALYAEPGSATVLKKMIAVITETKKKAAGYLEDSALTVHPELEDVDDDHGVFMQVGALVAHHSLMEQIRGGTTLKATPRPVDRPLQNALVQLELRKVQPQTDPPPPVPVQMVVGGIDDGADLPPVGPALDRLKMTIKKVVDEYEKTFSRYLGLRKSMTTSKESMAAYTYFKGTFDANVEQSKRNGDIETVPNLIRAMLGETQAPLLQAAKQAAMANAIVSPEIDNLLVLGQKSDMYGLLKRAFDAWWSSRNQL
jgi:hypothetical protein